MLRAASLPAAPRPRDSPLSLHHSPFPLTLQGRQPVRDRYTSDFIVTTNLKDELASLRIDKSARGGGGRGALIVVGLLLLAVAAGLVYWARREPVIEIRSAEAAVRSGAAGAANAVLNASGYVTARRRATVSSKVTGKVMEIFVEEGKAVRRGQVLARLDDSQL